MNIIKHIEAFRLRQQLKHHVKQQSTAILYKMLGAAETPTSRSIIRRELCKRRGA